MKLRKILTAVLAAVLSTVMLMSLTVLADSLFDEAKEIGSGKKVTKTLENYGDYLIYKITPTEKGTAYIKIKADTAKTSFFVFDSDGTSLEFAEESTSGERKKEFLFRSVDTGFYKGTLSFDVKANKTYYIKIVRSTSIGDGKYEVSFSYPTGESTDDAFLTVTLKKGDTLQLGANVTGDVTYSTSKKAVATVTTKGTVTAVKAGTATITVKSGSKSVKVKVIVQ